LIILFGDDIDGRMQLVLSWHG